jgi:hypothetical protein
LVDSLQATNLAGHTLINTNHIKSEEYIMSSQTGSQISASLLTKVIRADGLFALLSGSILLIGAGPVADLIDLAQPSALMVVGVVLLGYAGMLLYYVSRESHSRLVAQIAIVLNLAWVVGSYAGLLLGLFPVNTAGMWAIAIVAEVVFMFAIAEFIAIRKSA